MKKAQGELWFLMLSEYRRCLYFFLVPPCAPTQQFKTIFPKRIRHILEREEQKYENNIKMIRPLVKALNHNNITKVIINKKHNF
jgi:hypothetical protein